MPKTIPMLVHSEMTGRWYIATRYRILDDKGGVLATTKYDITDQIEKFFPLRVIQTIRDACNDYGQCVVETEGNAIVVRNIKTLEKV